LHSKDKDFIGRVSVPVSVVSYNYEDKDFVEHIVFDSDFSFMYNLASDTYDWELKGHHKVSKNSSISGYYAIKNYLPSVKWAQDCSVAKFVGILPYPLEACIKLRCTCYGPLNADTNIKEAAVRHVYSNASIHEKYGALNKIAATNTDRSICVYDVKIGLPFPTTTPRRYVMSVAYEYDPEEDATHMMCKPCHIDTPLPKKWIEMYNYLLITLRRIDESTTLIREVHLLNLGGWAKSKSLMERIVMDRAKGMHSGYSKALQLFMEGKIKFEEAKDEMWQAIKKLNIEEKRKVYLQQRQQPVPTPVEEEVK